MKYYMRDEASSKHDSGPDEGVIVHFSGTCNVQDVERSPSSRAPFGTRTTSIETRLVPSRKGWIVVSYEKKGMITFFVLLSPARAAWQRIRWTPDFAHWDTRAVQEAVDRFLWVAECEEAQQQLARLPTAPNES